MNSLPPITRNLLIANVVCYLLQLLAGSLRIDLTDLLGLHFVLADDFRVWQLVSYMFLHGSLTHLFFNMFCQIIDYIKRGTFYGTSGSTNMSATAKICSDCTNIYDFIGTHTYFVFP